MKKRYLLSLLAVSVASACQAHAEMYAAPVTPSQSDFGGVGLMQVPTARMAKEGEFSLNFRDNDQYRKEHRPSYLLCGDQYRLAHRVFTMLLEMPVNVLDHHHRRIDHHADAYSEAAERREISRQTGVPHQDKSD